MRTSFCVSPNRKWRIFEWFVRTLYLTWMKEPKGPVSVSSSLNSGEVGTFAKFKCSIFFCYVHHVLVVVRSMD